MDNLKYNLEQKLNEYDKGFIKEYKKEDGSIGLFNMLDLEVAKKYKQAGQIEISDRINNNVLNSIIIVIVIVIILLLLLYVSMYLTIDLTGIYVNKQGEKIKLYHNRALGNINIPELLLKADVKKIAHNKYGIYIINDNTKLNKLERMSIPIAAYVDLYDGSIIWKNDIWKLDRYGYRH